MSKFRNLHMLSLMVFVLVLLAATVFPPIFNGWAVSRNIVLVKKIIPAAQASMPNMDLPDAIDLSFYMDENQIVLSKVGGRVPVILAAEFSTGQLDPVQEKERQTGDLVLYSDGRIAKLWYFNHKNLMVPVEMPETLVASSN